MWKWRTKQPSVAAYSSEKIAERVAEARSSGWEQLGLYDCKVQDNDLRKLLGEPAVERRKKEKSEIRKGRGQVAVKNYISISMLLYASLRHFA